MKENALAEWLLEAWCERSRLDAKYIRACMAGEDYMWEGLASRIAVASGGRVPVSFWPRLRPDPQFEGDEARPLRGKPGVAATRRRAGPDHASPDFPLYAYLRKLGISSHQYAQTVGISHQLLSYRVNGERYAPLDFVERVRADTKGAVQLADWPRVRDWENGRRWEKGKLVKDGNKRKRRPAE